VKNGGTFAGLIEKIPYLKELGVTAVELLPIQEFDARENFRTNPFTGEKLANYWGYSTISFFAPKGGYALENGRGEQVLEFKRMVKALHKEGLELILDVVFNHTAEGNQMGPTLNFRGLDNTIYYILENGRYYKNFSGCGNTMNCNHPVVREYILNCLRYWVTEMHVDGFRFDLASILGRGPDGSVLENPPILEQISEDPVLRDTKIIAEAWDAAGLYQVGSFPGGRWAEWNGKYRDTLRAFWKGDEGRVSELATRLAGSSDLYEHSGRRPFHSINFITCHDGFTLEDLVSYNEKHNEANAENNTDGENNNMSFNYGHEGETEDREILAVRLCQRKNFMASLLVSQGVPMMLGGDEMGRTQSGNNNAWCQDNEISWMSWERLEKNRGFFRFVRCLIRLRKEHIVLRRNHFFSGNDGNADEIPDVSWFDHRGHDNPWHDKAKTLAFFLSGSPEDTGFEEEDDNFYFMMNAHHKPVSFRLPPVFRELSWKRVVDTSKTEPEDIYESGSEPDMPVDGLIPLEGRSLIVLINKTT
jgi:glycogen operon protein